MNIELIFKIFNTGILLPWLLLAVLPNWKGTKWMIQTKLPVVLVALGYVVMIFWSLFMVEGNGVDFTSFYSIKAGFTRDDVMLAGWLHYLAFDLFVGMWEAEDAVKRGVPHYLLVPCLFFTLMFGPVGFVLYWVLRQRYTPQETVA